MTETRPESLDDAMRRALKEAATVRVPPALTSSRFRIREELGRGGTSVVYAAHDRKLGREVALKVLRAESLSDPEMATRFRREAETAAKLTHPNIVTVYDVGWEDGRMILVMEVARGRSFAAALADGEVSTRRAVEILESVARAVHYAHSEGIIHRDLKPGNILLMESGVPKVADFGLARRLDSETALTASGTTLGTPGYMAPEQARGRQDLLSARTDVYGLGAILYTILTGKPPHDGDNPADVVHRVVYDDPVTPRRINPGAPADLELVALRALEKSPGRRYPDAAAFADELRRHLDGAQVQARPPGAARRAERWVRRHVALAAAGTVVLLALAGLGAALAVDAVNHAGRVSRLSAAISEEADPEKAADLCAQLRVLEPAFPGVDARLESLRAAARRRQAAALTSEGAEAAEQARVLEEQIARLRSERELLLQEPARRAELWRTEASLATLEHDLSEQYTRALALHAMAVEIDTTFAEPRRFLSAHYWKRFLEAEWEGDSLRMAEARAHLRLHDPAQARACDDARGSIVVTSVPPGAAVELFRYEEGEDRRLTPRPVTERAENLPAGSYLAVLTLEGRRAARLPFAITRRFPHVTAVVRLLTEQDIGPDFVHVPAGRYVLDADSDRKVIELPDLIVGRHEVTQGEYQEWLTWLAEAEGEKKMKERLPKGWEILDGRAQPKDEKDTDPRLPIVGIAWKQARDFCRWRAQRDGLDWRLPSVVEREAFVSAADARPFPWGRTFDWMWTNGGHSLETQKALPVGSVAADESPFGIRDLAGNVKEWCADWQEKKTTKHRAIRGGAYGDMDWTEFRASSEDGDPPDEEDEEIGFRIVRTLEPGR